MRVKLIILTIFVLQHTLLHADILDEYVDIGLKNNLQLQQKQFRLDKSMSALAEARGKFLPAVSFEARYSRAGGGRMIDIPIGDLINPMYEALGLPLRLENETIPFLREKEHETKLRVIQPVFQPGVFYNYKIKQELRDIEHAAKNIYSRHLISDIHSAYYNYLKAKALTELLAETHGLLKENVRVSQSLFKNNKVTKDAVHRAKAELYGFEEQQTEADKQRLLAKSYFNHLLNRPLSSDIQTQTISSAPSANHAILEEMVEKACASREELIQLQKVIDIAKHQKGLARSAHLPGVSAVVDYGYQGEKYQFEDEDDYWMASLVASWSLFNGFQNYQKVQQAKFNQKEQELQFQILQENITLQVQEAFYNLEVAFKRIHTTKQQKESAELSFKVIQKKYREGMSPQIELIDSRAAMIRAQVNAIVSLYDYQIQMAVFDKVMASVELPKWEE